MEKEWIPIIGTLGGVFFGGIIGSMTKVLELRSQRKQEVRKLKVTKLEELHRLILRQLKSTSQQTSHIKANTIDHNIILQYMDDILLIHSLVMIYLPQHEKLWSNLVSSFNSINTSSDYSSGTKGIDEIEKASKDVKDECAPLLISIEKEIRLLLK